MAKSKEQETAEQDLTEMSEEVVVVPVESIKEVDNMDVNEYREWLRSEGIAIEEFDGGGEWELLGKDDKARLIDTPFVIARLRFNDTKKSKKGYFVSVCAYLQDGTKIVFNDGSTGICEQLKTYTEKHQRTTAIACPKGLRVSEYEWEDEDRDTGEVTMRPGKTYYIA
jgi:hypothetical protein